MPRSVDTPKYPETHQELEHLKNARQKQTFLLAERNTLEKSVQAELRARRHCSQLCKSASLSSLQSSHEIFGLFLAMTFPVWSLIDNRLLS